MYIEAPFDHHRVSNTIRRVEADRDEFVSYVTATSVGKHDESGALSLFTRFHEWITIKIDELYASPFVRTEDRDATWKWYLEYLPAIYLSAIEIIWRMPELRDQFTGVLPSPPGDVDKDATSQIGYLIQGATESWPVSSTMRSMLLAADTSHD